MEKMNVDRKQCSINLLFVLALVTDLITPFLIWKGFLPAYTRWVSHLSVAIMMVGAYVRMMVFDRFPGALFLIITTSAIGVIIAFFEGSSIAAIAWGWWMMFQYPLVGLYAYLQPYWPSNIAQSLRKACMVILGVEVVFQIGQYITGEPPGDDLAGLFGSHGTDVLMIFILFVMCLTLGQWLAQGKWRNFIWVIVLASISSVLGEMKLFAFACMVLGLMTMVVHALHGRQRLKLLPYAVLIVLVLWAFVGLYNSVVPQASSTRPIQSYLDPRNLINYLNQLDRSVLGNTYYYNMGRNYAMVYGLNEIRRDTTTFLFGMGLGARGESQALGTAGIGLLRGDVGLSSGTSLLVMIQELGFVGLFSLGGFFFWTILTLLKEVKSFPYSNATELRYALILFSMLWPVWLWYGSVWVFRVPMLLYWGSLGYVLARSSRVSTKSTIILEQYAHSSTNAP